MSSEMQVHDGQRIIVVFSQKDASSREVHTSARTWGEFKTQNAREFDFTNIRGVVKETKNILEVEDALLPEGNFIMYLFPKKVKSGQAMYTQDEYLKSYTSKQLRKMCSEQGLSTSGTKEEYAKRLADVGSPTPKMKSAIVHEVKKSPVMEKSTLPALMSASQYTDLVVKARTTTEITARVTDVASLSNLLEQLFPNMKVVAVDGVINLKAELEWNVSVGAPVVQKKQEIVEEKVAPKPVTTSSKPEAAPKVEKAPVGTIAIDKKALEKEANDWAEDFL